MNFILLLVFLIGIYLLIGAILFAFLLFTVARMSGTPLHAVAFNLKMETVSGKKIEGIQALLYFIIKWPEVVGLINEYFNKH